MLSGSGLFVLQAVGLIIAGGEGQPDSGIRFANEEYDPFCAGSAPGPKAAHTEKRINIPVAAGVTSL